MFLKELDGIANNFRVQDVFLRYIGVNLLHSDKEVYEKPWVYVIGVSFVGFLVVLAGHYCYEHINNVDLVTDALSPALQFFLSVIKFSILLYMGRSLAESVRRIRILTQNASEEERIIIREENRRDYLFCSSYMNSITITLIIIFISPVAIGIKRYFETGEFYMTLNIKITVFVDMSNPLYYILFNASITLSFFYAVIYTGSIVTLYSWFVHHVAAQFRILARRIQNIPIDSTDDSINCSLAIDIIHAHQHILDIASDLSAAFRPILFAEFTVNIFQVCFLSYQVSQGIYANNWSYFLFYLCTVLIQLIIYSYGGQRVENESESLSNVIFERIPWEMPSKKSHKLWYFIMMRSQRSSKLDGFFFDVNLRLFLWVLRSAGSLVTLLRSVQ